MYTCKKCKKEFNNKSNFNRHLNRIIDCKTGSKTSKKMTYSCNKCGREFNRKDSMKRHNYNCKVNINKIKIQGNKNKTITGKKVNLINKSNNSKIINIDKIVLINFAEDGTSNISKDELLKLLGAKNNYVENLISVVNLNPNKPQHHNIYYGDTKSSYGEVYEDNKWVRKKIDEILEILIEAKISDLNEILNDMSDFLNENTREKIKKAAENVDYKKPGARKKLKTYLKPILYNNKDIIIKTRKLTKKQIEEQFKKEQEEAEREAHEEILKHKQNKK
jgi:DNA-directed RNA polymerase subunit RPC12/RpoP